MNGSRTLVRCSTASRNRISAHTRTLRLRTHPQAPTLTHKHTHPPNHTHMHTHTQTQRHTHTHTPTHTHRCAHCTSPRWGSRGSYTCPRTTGRLRTLTDSGHTATGSAVSTSSTRGCEHCVGWGLLFTAPLCCIHIPIRTPLKMHYAFLFSVCVNIIVVSCMVAFDQSPYVPAGLREKYSDSCSHSNHRPRHAWLTLYIITLPLTLNRMLILFYQPNRPLSHFLVPGQPPRSESCARRNRPHTESGSCHHDHVIVASSWMTLSLCRFGLRHCCVIDVFRWRVTTPHL